jgi:hypothetical protein
MGSEESGTIDMGEIKADINEETAELMEILHSADIKFKLIGGMAFRMLCRSSRDGALARKPVDIDMVIHRKDGPALSKMLKQRGYHSRERFNAIYGAKRLIFNDLENKRRIDVFLDVFEMCHKFDFSGRIDLDGVALSASDLLLTKLQIVQMSSKDFTDILSILNDADLAAGRTDAIDVQYIAALCSSDWGIYRTLTDNLRKVMESVDRYGLDPDQKDRIVEKIAVLLKEIDSSKKSPRWKIRSLIGTKAKWYVLPEEDSEIVEG